jgi:hypothetical protein
MGLDLASGASKHAEKNSVSAVNESDIDIKAEAGHPLHDTQTPPSIPIMPPQGQIPSIRIEDSD